MIASEFIKEVEVVMPTSTSMGLWAMETLPLTGLGRRQLGRMGLLDSNRCQTLLASPSLRQESSQQEGLTHGCSLLKECLILWP